MLFQVTRYYSNVKTWLNLWVRLSPFDSISLFAANWVDCPLFYFIFQVLILIHTGWGFCISVFVFFKSTIYVCVQEKTESVFGHFLKFNMRKTDSSQNSMCEKRDLHIQYTDMKNWHFIGILLLKSFSACFRNWWKYVAKP